MLRAAKPKAMKHPKEWRTAAARLRADCKMPLAGLAKALGVGQNALQRWCDLEKVGTFKFIT